MPGGDTFTVFLDEREQALAWRRGLDLRETATRLNAREYIRDPEKRDRNQCLGTLAEYAVGKALGMVAPLHDGTFKEVPDLPHEIEVRTIGVESWGLRVRPEDPDDRKVVGIIIPRGGDVRGNKSPPWRLPGWCFAREAKRTEWDVLSSRNGGRPVFTVPQAHLRPIAQLVRLITPEPVQVITEPIQTTLW